MHPLPLIPLPSREDAQRTLAWVNRARKVLGMRPRKYLPFSGCRRSDPHSCLLATALRVDDWGGASTYSAAEGVPAVIAGLEDPHKFARATGTEVKSEEVIVPAYVTRVVRAFDYGVEGLHERLREAGVAR